MKSQVNILLVEDNPGDAEFIQEIMPDTLSAQFHFTHVDRLSEAIRHLKEKGAQLALLDLGLPDSSGLDTVRQVRQAAPWIPIVVLTGHDDEAIGIAAVKAGAQDYQVKGKVSGDLLARVFLHAVERHQHQESLRASERFLQSTLDALSAHIAILSPSGKILAVNHSWQEFAVTNGANRTDGFIGVDYLAVCDQASGEGKKEAAAFAAGIRAVIDGAQETFGMEYPCHSPDQKRWFHGRVTPFSVEGRQGAVVSHENITTRKLAEEDLTASEKRLRLVLDTSPNCVFIKNDQGRYIFANKAITDLYATTQSAMIGKTDQEISENGILNWEEAEDDRAVNPPTFRTDKPVVKRNVPFTLSDGSVRWFSTIQTPIAFPSEPDCMLGIAVETTEQRKSQEELSNAELRLRNILDAQKSRVILLDTRMRILWPNREACQSAKMSPQEIIGRPCHEIWQQQSKICEDCPVALAIRGGEAVTTKKTTPDGRTWRIHGIPVYDDTGHIVSAVEVAEDITERIALEDQLRQAQKMESLGTLAGGIAHDFNNILSAILGYTELASEKATGSAGIESDLKEVYQAGLRAKDLVRQILTFSRRTETEFQPLQIAIIIREALKLLRSTIPTSIEIRQHLAKDLDPILADPTQIHQIIMNLCTNAAHAMEPTGGVLEVNLAQVEVPPYGCQETLALAPGQYLQLTVSDTGCGMTPEIMVSIFDPYFTTKGLGEGTGLGLSVVHGIVLEYGGDISVRSKPGTGSTFTLYFPTVKTIESDSQQIERRLLPGGTERILIVDDEPSILKINSLVLERQGYRVVAENDSLRALELFKKAPNAFDLVLSDVTMPKLTGDRLAEAIMAIRPDIPVILCTGYSRLITQQTTDAMGVRALVAKPVVKKTLLTEIRKVLDEVKEDGLAKNSE